MIVNGSSVLTVAWMKDLQTIRPLLFFLHFLVVTCPPESVREKEWAWFLPFCIHVVVQLLSHVWLFATPWTVACQPSLSFTISQGLLNVMSIESMMLSNQLIFCCPFLLLPSMFPIIKVFSSKLALYIRWPQYWSFSISPSNEYSRFISLRIDWFDLLTVQGTLKSLLQPHPCEGLYPWVWVENNMLWSLRPMTWFYVIESGMHSAWVIVLVIMLY